MIFSRLHRIRLAVEGITYALRTQIHMKIHLAGTVVVLGLGVFLSVTRIEMAILVLTCGIVWMAEIVNTAIELAVDLKTKKRSVRAKFAKDVASGAVLVTAIVSLVIGYLIFFDRLVNLLR